MDKQKVCKICSKRFPNGKAMGGHMRSHTSKLPLHPNSRSMPMPMPIPISRSDHHCSPSYLDLFIQDGESEMDPPNRRPSKRRREDDPDAEVEPGRLSTEDVALCLLMMSRDGRRREEASTNKENQNDFVSDSEEDEDEDEDEDEEDEEEEDSVIWKFQCKKCKKAFRSYQALGGHNASHRRSMNNNNTNINGGSAEAHRKVFECSFCSKVFDSGQALGGHKKVHFSILNSHRPRFTKNFIDLNRPASPYDYDYYEEDEQVSQVESTEISNPF